MLLNFRGRFARPSVKNGLDAVGNRLSRTSAIAGLSNQAFTYDDNDRLESDTYDANGNTKAGKITLNSQGAETTAQTANDSYDSENRLVQRSINNQPSTINIQYDGDGSKVSETVNGQTISYLIDTLNPTGYAQVVEELQNGTVIRTYTYGHDLLVQDQHEGTSWTATWFGYDGHGSVRLLTDALGQVTDRYDYDAFGVLLSNTGTTFNRYRYCGEQFESALGLYYLRARHMNAASGRFWTKDRYAGDSADPLSLHKYIYTNGDPVNGMDPSGYLTISELVVAMKNVAMMAGRVAWSVMMPSRNPLQFAIRCLIQEGIYWAKTPYAEKYLHGAYFGLTRVSEALKSFSPSHPDYAQASALGDGAAMLANQIKGVYDSTMSPAELLKKMIMAQAGGAAAAVIVASELYLLYENVRLAEEFIMTCSPLFGYRTTAKVDMVKTVRSVAFFVGDIEEDCWIVEMAINARKAGSSDAGWMTLLFERFNDMYGTLTYERVRK